MGIEVWKVFILSVSLSIIDGSKDEYHGIRRKTTNGN